MIIGKNERAADLKAKQSDSAMRRLDLTECQICYADGTVAIYEGNNCFTFELEEIDDAVQLRALHKLFDENATYIPKDFSQGWICSCGRFNKHEKSICSLWEKINQKWSMCVLRMV